MTIPVNIADIACCGAHAAGILSNLHGRCFRAGWSGAEFTRLLTHKGACAFVAAAARPAATSAGIPDHEIGFLFAQQVLDEAEIYAIGVLPAWRRMGIGGGLIGTALAELERGGVKNVFLEVAESNISAVECYRKCGFRVAGQRWGYYSGPKNAQSAIVMRRELAPQFTRSRHRI